MRAAANVIQLFQEPSGLKHYPLPGAAKKALQTNTTEEGTVSPIVKAKKVVWDAPIPPHHHTGPCECKNAIAYIRVSKVGDREETLISPDLQLESIRQYCVQRNLRIVKIVSDIDKSGRTFLSRSVHNVIKDIEAKVAQVVVVWKWSRWGRNIEHSRGYLAMTERAGGEVLSATEDFDQSSASGRFGRDMIMRLDEYLSDLIGEGWRAVQEMRRKNGLPHSGRRRFGYDYVDKRYVPNDIEGPVLKKVYENYVAGQSLRSLTRELNDLGMTTALGGRWTPEGLGLMLDTGFAAGLLRERSPERRKADKRSRNNLKAFDVWLPGDQKALITTELFEKYKARRAESASLPPRARQGVHALSTLVFCGYCSRRMSTRYHRTNHFWRCVAASAFHPETASVQINNSLVLAEVRTWVERRATENPPEVPVNEMAQAAWEQVRATSRDARQIDAEIEGKVKKLGKLVDMRLDGEMRKDVYDAKRAELESEIEALTKERATLVVHEGPEAPGYEVFKTLGEVWDDTPPDRLNAALRSVIGMVIVQKATGPDGQRVPVPDRLEIVGRWEMARKVEWLDTLRSRFSA